MRDNSGLWATGDASPSSSDFVLASDGQRFHLARGGEPILTMLPDGEILIRGRKAESDAEIVEALRTWMRAMRGGR